MENVENRPPPTDAVHGEPHAHSATPYYLVWVGLLIFTGLTWWTGQMHLGAWALPLAMVIALTKATLVLLFFMHLLEEKGANRLIVGLSAVFVLTLLAFVFMDLGFRYTPSTPRGAPFGTPLTLQAAPVPHEFQKDTLKGGGAVAPAHGAPHGAAPHGEAPAPKH